MNDISSAGFYRATLYKYKKFRRRLDKSIASGQFYRYTRRKQNELIRRIERLRRRLATLSTQLKLGGAAAAIALMLNSNSAEAQNPLGPFIERPLENPLRPPLPTDNYPAPFLIDFDSDGDLDLFVGSQFNIQYFINRGTKERALYDDPNSNEDPFEGTNWPSNFRYTTLVLDNFDADSDLEMVAADYYGRVYYFDYANGHFVDKTSDPNPFSEINIPQSYSAHPKLALADLDNDGDKDLYIGLYDVYADEYKLLESKNNGGTFAAVADPSWVTEINTLSIQNMSPAFGDLDGDGDLDLLLGTYDGGIYYFRNTSISAVGGVKGPVGFFLETGTWVPGTGGANPKGYPFADFAVNKYASPALADIDGDGDLDLLAGYQYDYYGGYDYRTLAFAENTGINTATPFTPRYDLESPVDGIEVGDEARISFGNILKDEPPAVIIGGIKDPHYYYGSTYYQLHLYKFQNDVNAFRNKSEDLGEEAPFGINNAPEYPAPVFVDLDNDGDSDLMLGQGGYESKIQYFQNDNGTFVEKIGEENPFDGITGNYEDFSAGFGDLDGDGLKDMVLTDNSYAVYYKNTGTATSPKFEQTDIDGDINPDDSRYFYGTARTVIIDLDHDGDLDVVIGKYDVWYYENIGTATSPEFVLYYNNDKGNPFQNINNNLYGHLSPEFFDFDKDGDMDILVGNYDGQVSYFKNENIAPTLNLATSVLSYGSQAIVVDNQLTLDDPDKDLIVQATIQILNYKTGDDVLSFTPKGNVTGNFDATKGILTLKGKATQVVYQDILRTVKYEYKGTVAGGRKGGRTQKSNKQIAFKVFDADLTAPTTKIRLISVPTTNLPPEIATDKLNTLLGGKVGINLTDIISDPDGNLDPNSFEIIDNVAPTPLTVGKASLENGILSIDYAELAFTGTDYVTIRACDFDGSCSAAEIAIEVDGGIVVYNGISPNGDGKNDFLFIRYIDLLSPQNKVSIFNRWGDKVFELEGYNNDNRRFEGKSDSGKELPAGVYFYVIEQTDRPKVTGYLTIK